MEVPQLIIDLTIMLMTAGVVTLVFKRLKLPVILGYIVAGFLISPYFPMFLDVGSVASIQTWSEIGVIIILFHIGLEFDLKKIANMGSTAVISALVKMSGVMVAGYGLGVLLGLSTMNSVFLGAMLSISSTVVIQKCFQEQGLQEEKFTSIVMGSLVMEDVFGVFIMVVLSTIAVSSSGSSAELAKTLAMMGCYLIVWLVLGIFIVPTILGKFTDNLNDETLTVFSIGFCFLMALIANRLGFSMELGAFLAGSLLAGTRQAENTERVTRGIKDLFGAVFFLSVGMMVDPAIISERWTTILPIAIVAVLAKLLFAMIGMILSGQDLETAIKGGVSLAPIGEFSFIIAALGISVGVMDEYLYPVIVSASILTIIAAPVLVRKADSVVGFLYRILPDRLIEKLDDYTSEDQIEEDRDSDWNIVIKDFLAKTLLFGVLMLMTAIVGIHELEPFLEETVNPMTAKIISCCIIFLVLSFFIKPLLGFRSVNFTHLWMQKMSNRPPLLATVIIRLAVIVLVAHMPLGAFFGAGVLLPLVIIVIAILIVGRTDVVQTYYLQLETRFLRNLNEKTLNEEEAEFGAQRWLDEDFSILSFYVPEGAEYVGSTIQQLGWGRRLSVYIAKIRRGSRYILPPSADTTIKAGDKVYAVAEAASLQTFYKTCGLSEAEVNIRTLDQFMSSGYEDTESALACAPIKLRGTEKYIGKAIKHSGILTKSHCMILGIQRDGYAITMPDANMLLLKGDILWVMGSNNNVGKLASHSVGQKGIHSKDGRQKKPENRKKQ